MTAAPAHEWFQVKGLIAARPTTHVRYRGPTGKHMLVLSLTGFDPRNKQSLDGFHLAQASLYVRFPTLQPGIWLRLKMPRAADIPPEPSSIWYVDVHHRQWLCPGAGG